MATKKLTQVQEIASAALSDAAMVIIDNNGALVRLLITDLPGSASYNLPIASLSILGGIKAGGNAEVDSGTAQITVTGRRDSTMAFADIPTGNVTYNELLARVAGYYAEINSRLKAPEKSVAGHLIASDGAGGTTLTEIANEVTEGDTRPISGGAVYTLISNINVILSTI